jgi:hypothetical protein
MKQINELHLWGTTSLKQTSINKLGAEIALDAQKYVIAYWLEQLPLLMQTATSPEAQEVIMTSWNNDLWLMVQSEQHLEQATANFDREMNKVRVKLARLEALRAKKGKWQFPGPHRQEHLIAAAVEHSESFPSASRLHIGGVSDARARHRRAVERDTSATGAGGYSIPATGPA